jgi:hypothetical protein
MEIDIRYVNVPASDALDQFVRRQMTLALRPCGGRIDNVEVRILDTALDHERTRRMFRDEETRDTREMTLVCPHESDRERGRISVLAPIGSALLGPSADQTIDRPLPGGKLKRLRIVRILYQPEQAGDWHL